MICAQGAVFFLTNEDEVLKPGEIVVQTDSLIAEVINTKKVLDRQKKPANEVICKYKVILDENPNCETTQDYVSHVSPAIREKFRRILRIEVYNIENIESIRFQSDMKDVKQIMEGLFSSKNY